MDWTVQGWNQSRGKRLVSYSKMSRTALGPVQPPLQEVLGFFPDLSPPSNAEVNTLWTGDADLRLYITTVQDR